MRILITGGAGFIGSHVTDAYAAKGHKVTVVDNLSSGTRKNVPRAAGFYRADIRDIGAMRKIMAKERPEVVSHHAAIMEVVKSVRDPLATFDVNVRGTLNLLMAFGEEVRVKRKRFIFASSGGAIYGDPPRPPASEAALLRPLSPYGHSKKLGEELVEFHARYFGFDYVNLRYGNVFGPRQSPHGAAGVIAIFGDLVKQGKRPTIFGDGSKTRDYIFVDDAVAANLAALRKGGDMTFNIGSGKGTSDQEVFEAIAARYGYKGKVRYAARRKGEVTHIVLDTRRARRILGWKSRTSFREGVRRTMDAL
jgi:UDP-glucose 4-epimerase